MTFSRSDWPEGLDEVRAFDSWRMAREVWSETYGWPGGIPARLRQEREQRHWVFFDAASAGLSHPVGSGRTVTAALDLVERLARQDPIPTGLSEEVDPVELGELAVRLTGWPAVEVGEVLAAGSAGGGAGSGAGDDRRLTVARFLVMIAAGDLSGVVDLAGVVDPLVLGLVAVQILGWPAVDDPRPWLDRLVLAEMSRAESW